MEQNAVAEVQEETKEPQSLTLFQALNMLADGIHKDNLEKGFWEDEDAVLRETELKNKAAVQKAFNGQRLALMHSELSEALEADRRNLMDDKLTQFKGLDVELADCLIRILDYCGRHQINVGEITARKLAYNRTRPHKHGKQY